MKGITTERPTVTVAGRATIELIRSAPFQAQLRPLASKQLFPRLLPSKKLPK